jgi:hypothetical protein
MFYCIQLRFEFLPLDLDDKTKDFGWPGFTKFLWFGLMYGYHSKRILKMTLKICCKSKKIFHSIHVVTSYSRHGIEPNMDWTHFLKMC